MMSLEDYYDVLGCTENSTHEEIKRAYRVLALQHHPDKCNSVISNKKFQSILEAWNILGNSAKREEYDAQRRQAELDMESVPIYAKLSPDELDEVSNDTDTLTHRCRCGGLYHVERQHLRERNRTIQVPCQECTFLIVIET